MKFKTLALKFFEWKDTQKHARTHGQAETNMLATFSKLGARVFHFLNFFSDYLYD